jgi:hypothetical protein
MSSKDKTEVQTTALAVLDPQTFVAEVFGETEKTLADALKQVEGVTYDITTKDGMETAKECRALLRGIRTGTEETRKKYKAPIIEAGRLIDDKAAAIKAQIEPVEDRFHNDIKNEEDRREAEKAAKIRAEEEAKAAIQSRLDKITKAPLAAIDMSAADTQALIDELSQVVPSGDEYGDRFVEAEVALQTAITQLKSMHTGKVAQEAMAKQHAKEAEERERVSRIQTMITDIKNLVMEGAECETTACLKVLIDKVEALTIDKAAFAEFYEEAKAAHDKVLTTLNRQMGALKYAEAEAAKARQENAEMANTDQPALVADPSAQPASISRGEDSAISIAPTHVGLDVGIEDHTAIAPIISAKPTGNVRYFEGIRPSDAEIIDAVATAFGASREVAQQWLVDSFGMKAAA